MNAKKKQIIQQMIYEMENEELMEAIERCDDPEILYVYAYNYNWDNGFDVPTSIIHNDVCELCIALLIFYSADGLSYLENRKAINGNLKKWSNFISELYQMVIDNKFIKGDIKFVPPLSKVQIYKLKKILDESDYVFVEPVGNHDLNINI